MSISTSTLESSTNSSAATSTMPRSALEPFTGGAASRMGSPLEAARLDGRPDAVDQSGPARVAEAREHHGRDLLHGQHVLRVAGPGSILQLVPDAEAVHVVGGHLRRQPVLVAHERGLPERRAVHVVARDRELL